MAREPEEWGGEVRLPNWLRRMLRRPAPPDNSAERTHGRVKRHGRIQTGAHRWRFLAPGRCPTCTATRRK
jgi:hypothetical protein